MRGNKVREKCDILTFTCLEFTEFSVHMAASCCCIWSTTQPTLAPQQAIFVAEYNIQVLGPLGWYSCCKVMEWVLVQKKRLWTNFTSVTYYHLGQITTLLCFLTYNVHIPAELTTESDCKDWIETCFVMIILAIINHPMVWTVIA